MAELRSDYELVSPSLFLPCSPESQGFPGGSNDKEAVQNVGDPSSIPRLERSPGEGSGNPVQYFCLENPMYREVWQAAVHRVAQS